MTMLATLHRGEREVGMTVLNMQFGKHWARNFGGDFSHSVTVQVPGVAAVCETALTSTWTAGEAHSASDAMITQCVSASGVENFPLETTTDNSLVVVIFRQKVTSVTFKVDSYKTKSEARWMIYHWG